jgi:predicted nucleotidyltransferase
MRNRLARLFAENPPEGVVSVYLFGSHAEGRSHRESDLDLGVLLTRERFPTASDSFAERIRLGSWLMGELLLPKVDIVLLEEAPPILARRIVTEGIRVYCADTERDHCFVRNVQLRAADLEPFLRRMRAIKLEALDRLDPVRQFSEIVRLQLDGQDAD